MITVNDAKINRFMNCVKAGMEWPQYLTLEESIASARKLA